MANSQFKCALLKLSIAAGLLLGSGAAMAQSTVTLAAGPTSTTLPDGQKVPMWGYTCGDALAAAVPSVGATCTAANGAAQSGTSWQPPLIRMQSGQSLTITLVNNLSFPNGTATPAAIPTSLVIVGQLGGGLGDPAKRTTMPSPVHKPQGTTWPGTLGSIDPATAAITVGAAGAGYVTPPAVSITGGGSSAGGASAVATIANGVVTGIVVSSPGTGYTAAPTVTIDPPPCTINATTCIQATATISLSTLQSSDGSATFVPPAQLDRVRSFATEVAAGGSVALCWGSGASCSASALKPGTYLIHSGTQPSIQHPMGLYGVLVVTDGNYPGTYPNGTTYNFDSDVALLLSEIDPDQNRAVDVAVRTAGFDDKLVWNASIDASGVKQCGHPDVHTCYPPAVNYSPLYYLVNGTSFDRTSITSATQSILPLNSGSQSPAASGRVLLRMVNAGLRLHVPSVTGATLTLLAEDGNKLPGIPRKQASVSLVPGKVFDATIEPTQASGNYVPATYAMFDRALGLSTANQRDGGMQSYINVAGGAASGSASSSSASASLNASDQTYYCVNATTLSVTDPSKGLLRSASGANGVALGTNSLPAGSALSLQPNGTFTYTPPSTGACEGSFTFSINNGAATKTATIANCSTSSTCSGAPPVAGSGSFTSHVATRLQMSSPGVLALVTNTSGLPLKAKASASVGSCASVTVNEDGSFVATPATPGTSCTFNYKVTTSTQQTSGDGLVTVNFEAPSGLTVAVMDAKNGQPITDYRWIIEEDRTVKVDPKCQINSATRPMDSFGRPCPALPVESQGYNFHTANMPVIAQGCVGTVSCELGQTVQGSAASCDIGNGICRAVADSSGLGVVVDATAGQKVALDPKNVHLDPNKHYFISVLPGDGVNPTIGGAGGPMQIDPACDPTAGSCAMRQFDIAKDCGAFNPSDARWIAGGANSLCGHGMGGAPIKPFQSAVNINLQQTPLPTAKISVLVFQDDNPLNGENDAGGGVDVLAPNEPGLGGFEIKIFDQAGGLGDNTGQVTYDQFNQPLSNSLAGKKDPTNGNDACPITARKDGLIGMIPVCPKYESDGKTLSPLAGQAVIANLFPGLYEIQAYPAADRIAAGEEWLQTNTLDGGKPHEAFIKPNEPGYFQEFGPGGYHVAIGYANPKIINGRKGTVGDGKGLVCSAPSADCTHKLTVHVANNHMSRTPDQRTFSTNSYDHYGFTQCYVSVGPADAEDFAFAKCDADGNAVFENMPNGTYKISVFDQWNDIMLDGLVGTVVVNGNTEQTFPVTQWRTNLYTRTFLDSDRSGASTDAKSGLALVNTNIRYRDGSIGFFNNTDLNGYAGFNEVFPFMNWLVVETSSTRFKPTGTHTVYDAGGPVDGQGGADSTIAHNLANTVERVPLPASLKVPGARYCATADCLSGDAAGGSSGAVMPPQAWGNTQGWQGLLGQNTFIEFGMKPFADGENGGIAGHVIYASTRPFDDPSLSLQLSWEPGVPNVRINLYQKTVDDNGVEHLTLADTTMTTSWDDWSQGFRKAADGVTLLKDANGDFIPNMNCPGQDAGSPFFATLKDSKQWLDQNNPKLQLASHAQFKCYDGWSQLNQVQPAPYDGMYKFPSVTAIDAGGKPAATNCKICVPNPDTTDPLLAGKPMLPAGKYVVEVIVPQGYELVKEEDKNILLGDVYIAPVTQQFAGFGNVFIMPDQAAVNARYNANNPGALNLTNNIGSVTFPRHEGDTGSVEAYWPCVGAERIVPDLNSLFPGAGQAAPFAGAKRRLCDRKEVTLDNQASALAKFYVFSSTHIAGHFTGTITNDFASEFDPFSPQFGEKFGPPNLPVGMRDFNGNEVARVYSDQWGIYNGLYFSSWTVNPPNPTGYSPQMSIACMNDPGPIPDPTGAIDAATGKVKMITDPSYNPAYSNFCYETPFMPGFTAYMDTPVIPTQAFADGYNLPDTEYPDGTPAIASATTSSAQGPWVQWAGTTPAHATFTFSGVDISILNAGDHVSSVTVGGTTLTSGAIYCDALRGGCPTGTSSTAASARNTWMAQRVAANINAGSSGYKATSTGASVTITGPVGTGASSSPVTVSQTGITVSPSTLVMSGGSGSPPSGTVTLLALGDKVVQNPNFAGPNATTAPYNQKTITRHYGFGSGAGCTPTPPATTCEGGVPAGASVTVGGIAASVTKWSDSSITINVPLGMPLCAMQQRGQSATLCGEVVITAANGKQSIDAITLTVGGSAPWVVTPNAFATNTGGTVTSLAGKPVKDYTSNFGRMYYSPIQTAIDSADPGDLILVQPGTYRENLIMWKPVRLQGVGAASVTINADAHPAGKMDEWRRQMVCAFGLDVDGIGNPNNRAYDPSGKYSCPMQMFLRADRIPFEAITGWDASGNGNLAQVLQEPTLMGAYEGAGITVVGRGVKIPANSVDFWGADPTAAGAFADGSIYLNGAGDCAALGSTPGDGRDYATSNYNCNPSSIDGLSITNSSQGGGGVFVHGWGHNLDIANTRVLGNHGTLAGAINLGNGETPPVFLNDGTSCGAGTTALCPPIPAGTLTNGTVPFGFNTNVHIHHNMLYNNASIGDALFTGTPAGAGGITVSAGADGYRIDHNWIAGNLSTGDGGGLQSLGVSFNGQIRNNYILFNQSTNPTLPTSGGGIVIQAANEPRMINGVECGALTDFDCPPGLGDGTGAGLVIDGNLIIGNSAESGSGGGLRLQQINGSEMIQFPVDSTQWFGVTVTNNIIANNVAGWDGGGVSMQDALKVSFINNTVVSNDTTASAGSLFKTLGAVNASSPPPGCTNNPSQQQNLTCPTTGSPHAPQPAGLVTMAHTPNLVEAIGNLPSVRVLGINTGVKVLCPAAGGQNYGYTGTPIALLNSNANGDCMKVSKPLLVNDLFWHNRAFSVDIVKADGTVVSGDPSSPTGTGLLDQQNLIALSPMLNQQSTGQCALPTAIPDTFYYDVGLRTDDVTGTGLSFTNNKLRSYYSIVSHDPQGVLTSTNPIVASSSPVVAEFCNGARVAPEMGSAFNGYNAPPGASETTGLATAFVFNAIKPTATVDEGHNWLNLTYGPLTLNRSAVNTTATNAPELMVATASVGVPGGAYSIPGTSPAAGAGVVNAATPKTDFFGRVRSTTATSVGAVEVAVAVQPPSLSSISPTSGVQGATVAVTLTGTSLAGATSVSVSGTGVVCSVTGTPTTTTVAASCDIASTATIGARSVTVTTPGGTSGGVTFTVNPQPPAPSLNCPATTGLLGSCNLLNTASFGSVGNTTTGATLTFTLSNAGGGFQISTITAVKNGGTNGNGTYSVVTGAGAGTCVVGATIAGGTSCTVVVRFLSPAGTSLTGGVLTVTGTPQGGGTAYTAVRNLLGS